MGVWFAWAAVYAFVLNAMLASFLLAAVPVSAFAAGHELCITSSSTDAAQTDAQIDANGVKSRMAAHCKLCCPGLAAVTPPPSAPVVFARIAVAQPQQVAFERRLKQFSRFTQTSPRGPPALI